MYSKVNIFTHILTSKGMTRGHAARTVVHVTQEAALLRELLHVKV